MRKKKLPIALLLTTLLTTPTTWAETQTQASDAELMAFTCFGCHGENGNSKGATPTLTGLAAEYIIIAMQDFKSGARSATVMNRIAKGYTDEEIRALANYFSLLQKGEKK